MIVAIFGQTLPRNLLEDNPFIYRDTRGLLFSSKEFTRWILRVLVHSAIIFFIPFACVAVHDIPSGSGQAVGIWYTSTLIYTCVVMVASLILIFDMTNINLLHVIFVVGSLIVFFVCEYAVSFMQSFNSDMVGVTARMWGDFTW